MPSCVIRFFHRTGKKVASAPVTDLDHTNRKMAVPQTEDMGVSDEVRVCTNTGRTHIF